MSPIGPRALIAGGGVAGLETALALRALAGDRVAVTIVAPELRFVNRSMASDQPFKCQRMRGIRLASPPSSARAGVAEPLTASSTRSGAR